VAEAVATLRRERRGRDVYVLGAANVGKSAFVRRVRLCAACAALAEEQAAARVVGLRCASSPGLDALEAAARMEPVEGAAGWVYVTARLALTAGMRLQ
jgi:hypothetical protein